MTNDAIEALISNNSKDVDAIMLIDGSVKRGWKSAWAFTVRCRREYVKKGQVRQR